MEPAEQRAEKARVYPLLIADLVAARDIADPSIAAWAAPIILDMEDEGASTEKIGRRLREEGEPLSADRKRELGLPTRTTIGDRFAAALTANGRSDPSLAAFAIAHHPWRSWGRAYMRALVEYDGVKARMLIRDDEKTCAPALVFRQQMLWPHKLPVFPLPECDKWVCRCGFDRDPSDKAGAMRRRRDAPPMRLRLRVQERESPTNAPSAPAGRGIWKTLIYALLLLLALAFVARAIAGFG